MTLLDDALALHAAGLCVLPAAEDGSKRPAVDWKQYQHERPDEAQLRRWFGGTRAGLGIVCGKVSGGVELTEVEGAAVKAGALVDLAELVDQAGETELWRRVTVDGYAVMSPSGGLHLLYRLAGAEVPGNTKLAATAEHVTLAETRGEGGWVVTAPSAGTVHPTGRAWRVAAGTPAAIPTITADERARLHRLVRSLDQRPVPAPPAPASPFAPLSRAGAGDGISPGDDYNNRAEWSDVLDGWRLVFTRGPVGYWRRPGKSTGISATTGYGEGDWLYPFTSSTELEPERTYTKFGAYAALHHGGDHAAAAKALQAQNYGRRTERVNLDHLRPVPAPPASSAPASAAAAALAIGPAPITAASAGAQPIGGYTLTDTGNAQLLVAAYGHQLRYVPERGAWLRWAGHRWDVDEAGEHVELVKRAMHDAIDATTDDPARKHYNRSLSRRGIEAAVALARTDPAIVARQDHLDQHAHLLATPAGAVDLRTGELLAVDPAQLHTRSTLVAPDPELPTPHWHQFLADTFGGDVELTAYVQRLLGYSATGNVDAHVLPFAYGASGQNGKSVLMDVVQAILADYAGTAPGSFLTTGPAQHETEVARLAGLRFVIASEVDQQAKFAEAKVKLLTGGDRLTARFMRRDHFTWSPTHKLWLMGNHQPKVTAGGNSFWRRLRLLPFRFTVPAERRNLRLAAELIADEAPGILAWIIAGARAYYAGGLADPASVLAATREYAEQEDDLGRFVADRLVLVEGAAREHVVTDTRQVTAAYSRWCHDERVDELSAQQFGRELRGRWPITERRSNGRRFYVGVSVLADDDGPTYHQPAHPRLPFTPLS